EPRREKLVARLADELAEVGQYDEAIKTYRYLIEQYPMGSRAPVYQQGIVSGFEQLRQRDRVRAEVKRLAELYRPGTAWWRANETQASVLTDAFEVTEAATRNIVTEYHSEAQKTKQVETYRLARDIYRQYLDAFASSKDERFIS